MDKVELSNGSMSSDSYPVLGFLIASAAQQQIAGFFNSGTIPDPNSYLLGQGPLFEKPAVLPEQLNFFQIRP